MNCDFPKNSHVVVYVVVSQQLCFQTHGKTKYIFNHIHLLSNLYTMCMSNCVELRI